MRKLIILLLITIMSVGCSKLKEKSSDNTLEDSQASSKQTLQIDDVEGYWECRSSEDDILLRIGWKNDIDIYYSGNSKENASYNIIKSMKNSIEIEIENDSNKTQAIITTDDNGESITFKRNKNEYYFIRIPKDKFYEKLNIRQKEKMKANFRKCSAIIGLTRDWKDFLTNLIDAEEKVYIINNFVEIPTTFSEPNNETANVSFLGRIGERKGTFDLLNAIELLNKNTNIQFRVNIAGDGEIEKCKKYIKDKELYNVKYLGWINEEERNRLLQKTDILILPSYYESFGMVLIEAMSYKIPVIGGNAGSIPNVITNNFDGLLVEPGNVTDIANKLEYLLCNPKIRVKMGQNGYKSVCEKYSSKYFSQKLDELYKKLIGVNKNEQ